MADECAEKSAVFKRCSLKISTFHMCGKGCRGISRENIHLSIYKNHQNGRFQNFDPDITVKFIKCAEHRDEPYNKRHNIGAYTEKAEKCIM